MLQLRKFATWGTVLPVSNSSKKFDKFALLILQTTQLRPIPKTKQARLHQTVKQGCPSQRFKQDGRLFKWSTRKDRSNHQTGPNHIRIVCVCVRVWRTTNQVRQDNWIAHLSASSSLGVFMLSCWLYTGKNVHPQVTCSVVCGAVKKGRNFFFPSTVLRCRKFELTIIVAVVGDDISFYDRHPPLLSLAATCHKLYKSVSSYVHHSLETNVVAATIMMIRANLGRRIWLDEHNLNRKLFAWAV